MHLTDTVSIPHRYDPNGQKEFVKLFFADEFQFLIGTIQTVAGLLFFCEGHECFNSS